jgi:hypothetical protein
MPVPLERRLFFLLIATMAWSGTMFLQAKRIVSPDYRAPAGCYFSGTPIVDIELSSTASCFRSAVTQGNDEDRAENPKLVRINTYMDCVFIVLYWASFVTFARMMEGWPTKLATFLVTLSALADIWENLRIFSGLQSMVGSASDFTIPCHISQIKWVLLGVVLVFLAIAVWLTNERRRVLLSAAMAMAGVSIVAGLAFPLAMKFAPLGLLLTFVLLVLRVWPYSADQVLLWIEYGFLLRFQISMAVLLAVALPLAYRMIPSLFVGLFDASGFISFVFIVWAAFQLAWTIMVTIRIVLVYGPDRFARASWKPGCVSTGMVALYGLLAVPPISILLFGSDHPRGFGKLAATLIGLLLAILVLFLTASLHFAIEDPEGGSAQFIFPSFGFLQKTSTPKSQFWKVVGLWLNRILPQDLQPGILDGSQLRSGHEMAAIALAIFLVIYAVLGFCSSPQRAIPESQPAALFFLLLILTVFTWLLSGAAFFLDRTRLPVFTTLLAVSLLTGVTGTDNKYEIRKTDGAIQVGSLAPDDIVRAWKRNRGKGAKTALVVATAGGGIRAAAWTAEVMTRLQEGCKATSDSLLLVSSVSGGSVGSMFVVAPYEGEGDYPTDSAKLGQVRFNTKRSSLSAVGWGMAYPDLLRTAPVFGGLVSNNLDRGWALENAWATAWRNVGEATPTLAQWRDDVSKGRRPAVIFNATASESGERFLIASTDGKFEGARQFTELFPGKDIDVSTAARLSATFPYISPLARASEGPVKYGYHVGDGGYYDNSGLLSAVEWLKETGGELNDREILLILIDAKPDEEKHGSKWSWQRQLVGPLETLLHVRSSSQQTRETVDMDMVQRYLTSQDSGRMFDPNHVKPELFLFSSKSEAPLSWHLTAQQKTDIGNAWQNFPANIDSWSYVRAKLGCSSDPTQLQGSIESKENK